MQPRNLSDKQYEARDYARTLMDADQILDNKSKLAKAKKAAKLMFKEKKEELASLQQLLDKNSVGK